MMTPNCRNDRRARTVRFAAAGLVATLCAIVPIQSRAKAPEVITIAVPPEGGTGYVFAEGYSKVISDHAEVGKVVLQPFSSATAWPVRMNAGEVNFAQHCGFEQIAEAYRGTGPFASVGPQRNLRNVATMFGNPWTISVTDPAAKTLADLKGKTVFVQVSHTDHVTALKVLFKSVGLEYGRDVKIIPFRDPVEAIQGLSSGRADGIAFALIPGLVELKRSKGLHPIPIPLALARKVQAADPVWGIRVVRKGTGALAPPEDVPVLEIECGMAASAKTSADTVYRVMKAIYDYHSSWVSVHPLARQTTPKKGIDVVVVPFHDGAVRFYKEAGLWTPELAAKQSELLKQKS
jgi:uncharacterized protein